MWIGRKRRRGELGRVAEIVMVLAAAGEARAGRVPTAAERALAAEARGRLLGAVAAAGEVLRPWELFPKEAVRQLVEDLGLSRAMDPAAMGYRPQRASIAERILLTKRKLEEMKEAPVYPTTNVPQTAASSVSTVFQHGASTPTTGLPRNLSAVSTFPTTTPVSVPPGSGASSVKAASISSIVSVPSIDSENVKVEKGVNGPNFTQNEAAVGKAIHTARTSNSNTIHSSSQAVKSQNKTAPTNQPITVNTVMRHQSPSGVSFVQEQSVFSNHNAIAKNVQQVLHQPVNHPIWTLPSTEYMHSRLDCQLCKVSITDTESLLVCDACERGMHLKCLQHYGSSGLPKAEWYCPTCVARSKGKSLPPKYGKVTRTGAAPNASVTSGATSQRASANPTMKDNSKEVAANEIVNNIDFSEADKIVHNSNSLDVGSSKEQSVSASGPLNENVEHSENSSKQKVGHAPPCSGIVAEAIKSSSEFRFDGASTNLQQSHMQSKSSELPSSAVHSENDSMLKSSAVSVVENFDCSLFISSGHEVARNTEQNLCNDVETTSSSRRPAHQADGAVDMGIEKPQDVQMIENNAISEHSTASADVKWWGYVSKE